MWTLAQAVAPAVTGGCNLVVLREADLPAGPRSAVARFVRDGVRERVPYLLAGDPALALAVGADGVHLEATDAGVAGARDRLGPEGLLGVTVRNPAEAQRAEQEGADYLLIEYDWSPDNAAALCRGAIHRAQSVINHAPTHQRAGSKLEAVLAHFRDLRAAVRLPIVLGTDMPPEWIPACRNAGAAGVAICEPAMSAYDRTSACRAYWEILTGTGQPTGESP
jgi:thiamine-phosphate pyrophosphorylase